ncbi:MAG: restriction endonuclease [Deltaproteobacteria bacterium]|nr:MAG: restriction endonuclease [Deltaproteobacteria bacterium]
MTFTEAAVEVLRRTGKPLHYKEIADVALRDNLLSHVGQDPEITMGQRLAAMAKREDDRKVVAVLPEGTFALIEWSVPQEAQVEPVPPPMQPAETGEALYRPREREPRAIHAQARRRLAELQAEHEEGYEEVEAERRRQDQGRKGQRRFPPPAEVVFEALAQRQSGSALAELAADLLRRELLSDALVRDLPSLVAALLEDNRRRTEAGRKPAFIVDGDRVTLVEFPPASALLEEVRAPHGGARPMGAAQLGAEVRRAVVRALRRRVAELDTGAFENLCAALLEKMGMRDVRVAKRSKEGPLYLARQRRGVSDLRVAVKLVRGGREIGRADVQELRKDLAHYSAQMGLVLAPGDAGRDARSEASAAAQAPVALYVGEAFPEEMIACRVGVTVQTVEVPDLDEAFFAGLSRQREERAGRREREDRVHEEPAAAASEAHEISVEATPAAEPAPTEEAQTAPEVVPPEPVVQAAEGEEPREARRRRGREDRPRATNAAEQAWGQPAGTLRFAPPPGPTVVSSTTPLREEASVEERAEERAGDERREEAPADERHEGEAEQTPASDPQKPDPF